MGLTSAARREAARVDELAVNPISTLDYDVLMLPPAGPVANHRVPPTASVAVATARDATSTGCAGRLRTQRAGGSFILTLARPVGSKRGKAEGSFVRETRAHTFDFYRDLVGNLKVWQARPPKLREAPSVADVPEAPQPDPPPFVAADEREAARGQQSRPRGIARSSALVCVSRATMGRGRR